MTGTANLILSLLWSASLGAAQDSTVDCGDDTHCPANNFCSKPAGSSRMVCASVYPVGDPCQVCRSNVMVVQHYCYRIGSGQESCQPLIECDEVDCPIADQFCSYVNSWDGACFNATSNNASEPVDCGENRYCPSGSSCYYEDLYEKMLCAPKIGNDLLCNVCKAASEANTGPNCYPSSQVGTLACKASVNCADDCDDVDNQFCLKTNSTDGFCFPYSVKNSD